MTRLVTVAHGTRQQHGNRVAAELTAAAAERLDLAAVASYVELCEPLFADVVSDGDPDGTTVAVPLLLSTGFHLRVDLPEAVAAAPGRVVLGSALGPDPVLASAQAARLVEAGARPGQPVTMVAAGSRDAAATADLERAADLLAGVWGGPVRLATLAGNGLRPADVVQPGDVVSPYLLSEGHFYDRCRDETTGADAVATVIGPHPLVVELIVTRATALLHSP